jgi:phage virion morphogenesis protein
MLQLRLDAKGAIKGLQAIGGRLAGRMRDLTPVTRDMGERMEYSIEENFRRGGRPERWEPSKKAEGMTLIETARLKNSITYRADRKGLSVGTNVIYARIHQLGGKAGKGHKVTIPARPFLVVQESDLAYFRRRILEHIQRV